jgi:hypothetical protein
MDSFDRFEGAKNDDNLIDSWSMRHNFPLYFFFDGCSSSALILIQYCLEQMSLKFFFCDINKFLQFTVYSLQFTVYSLQFTVYSLQFTVYSLQLKA